MQSSGVTKAYSSLRAAAIRLSLGLEVLGSPCTGVSSTPMMCACCEGSQLRWQEDASMVECSRIDPDAYRADKSGSITRALSVIARSTYCGLALLHTGCEDPLAGWTNIHKRARSIHFSPIQATFRRSAHVHRTCPVRLCLVAGCGPGRRHPLRTQLQSVRSGTTSGGKAPRRHCCPEWQGSQPLFCIVC